MAAMEMHGIEMHFQEKRESVGSTWLTSCGSAIIYVETCFLPWAGFAETVTKRGGGTSGGPFLWDERHP